MRAQKVGVRTLLFDVLQVPLHDLKRRQSIHTLEQLLRQHSRLERFVVNNHSTPEQRFIGAEPCESIRLPTRFLPVASSAGRETFETARRNESGTPSAWRQKFS